MWLNWKDRNSKDLLGFHGEDLVAHFWHCGGHSYLWQYCQPGMCWVALVYTYPQQINTYMTTQHWWNPLSISSSLAVAICVIRCVFADAEDVEGAMTHFCPTSHAKWLIRGFQIQQDSISNTKKKCLEFVLWRKVCKNCKELHWGNGSVWKNEGRINTIY